MPCLRRRLGSPELATILPSGGAGESSWLLKGRGLGEGRILRERDLREGRLRGDLNNSGEKALRSCLPRRGVCGHGIARDAAVPVPLDTGCILSETAGKRWKEERGQPASKCCSPLVLSCWSWTSGKSISLAQVRAQHLDVWERQWLGEGTWKRKS